MTDSQLPSASYAQQKKRKAGWLVLLLCGTIAGLFLCTAIGSVSIGFGSVWQGALGIHVLRPCRRKADHHRHRAEDHRAAGLPHLRLVPGGGLQLHPQRAQISGTDPADGGDAGIRLWGAGDADAGTRTCP